MRPVRIRAIGGCGGTYVKTPGQAGLAQLTLAGDQGEPVRIFFNVTISE